MMFSEEKSFYPNKIFIDFQLTDVKNHLNSSDIYKIKDFGSIVIAENNNYLITINNIGKVKLFYNSLDEKTLNSIIYDIEKSMKKTISELTLSEENKYFH